MSLSRLMPLSCEFSSSSNDVHLVTSRVGDARKSWLGVTLLGESVLSFSFDSVWLLSGDGSNPQNGTGIEWKRWSAALLRNALWTEKGEKNISKCWKPHKHERSQSDVAEMWRNTGRLLLNTCQGKKCNQTKIASKICGCQMETRMSNWQDIRTYSPPTPPNWWYQLTYASSF